MNRIRLALRMCLGGAVCGSFLGMFGGGLLGGCYGGLLGNVALGLDGALLGGAAGCLAGAVYGGCQALTVACDPPPKDGCRARPPVARGLAEAPPPPRHLVR
jgi:hypothetical protein